MILSIILCVSLNVLFLRKSYQGDKVKCLKSVYSTIVSGHENNMFEDEEFLQNLDAVTSTNNILMGVVDADLNTIYCSVFRDNDVSMFFTARQEEIDAGIPKKDIVESKQDYMLRYTNQSGLNYLEMFGVLEDGCMYLLRLPVSSIYESVEFANKFYMLSGIIGAVVGSIIIYCFMTKLLKPIENLNKISNRMVDLDFTARYSGTTHNEIDILGENMNILSDSLERSIAELKQANMELANDLENKVAIDEIRQDLIASVSHDMKTPIAIIQGYAEGLKDGVASDPENLQYYCDVIIDEAAKMNKMLRFFFNLNDLQFGHDNIEIDHFDVTEVIKGYLSSAEMIAKQEGIKVIFDEKSEYVWADELKAETVLDNFFTNAVHYCKANKDGDKIIHIYFERVFSNLRIHVRNTGDYIDEDKMENLWEKFYKVDESRSRQYGGNGLGLAIVKAIQELLCMKYGVSNVSDGVDFWYELDAEGSRQIE